MGKKKREVTYIQNNGEGLVINDITPDLEEMWWDSESDLEATETDYYGESECEESEEDESEDKSELAEDEYNSGNSQQIETNSRKLGKESC